MSNNTSGGCDTDLVIQVYMLYWFHSKFSEMEVSGFMQLFAS